jgi:hypothetical protein
VSIETTGTRRISRIVHESIKQPKNAFALTINIGRINQEQYHDENFFATVSVVNIAQRCQWIRGCFNVTIIQDDGPYYSFIRRKIARH